MNQSHHLYFNCQHDPSCERYGLLQQKTNSFYIIDNDPSLLKRVQLFTVNYELLHFVNIDHFFNFLDNTSDIVEKYKIKSMMEAHEQHVKTSAVYYNNNDRKEKIQKNLNNHNCFLFGLTTNTARSMSFDVNHGNLNDNIIQHDKKDNIFDNELQEKLFLIRRLLFLLQATFEYSLNFVIKQEKICNFGLEEYIKHFNICYPFDKTITNIAQQEIESNNIRIKSINALHNVIYKRLYEIDFNRSIKEIILQCMLSISSKNCIQEAEKNYKSFIKTYDIDKIISILINEFKTLSRYYE